jgi:LSD1 subclass zinc finger protein
MAEYRCPICRTVSDLPEGATQETIVRCFLCRSTFQVKELEKVEDTNRKSIDYREWKLNLIGIITNSEIHAETRISEIKAVFTGTYDTAYGEVYTPQQAWEDELEEIKSQAAPG